VNPRQACALLPAEPGVYRFRDARGRVCYLGRATNLRSRTLSYWGGLVDRPHLRRMTGQIAAVEALVCASVHEAAWLERNLLERSLPRWNRVRGGAEIPAWLVLDPTPERPELRLSIAPDANLLSFGPYLGVERARLARGGLLRVWPVQLTGRHPDAADTTMAEARGVSVADREAFAAGITGVLSGDPSALATHAAAMLACRERAQEMLAFETAQLIQEELVAVTVLAAPQRVTGCRPHDLIVNGWADGVLLTLSATAGRLDRWITRPASADTGGRLAAATPPEWQEFAQLNAELAARLR